MKNLSTICTFCLLQVFALSSFSQTDDGVLVSGIVFEEVTGEPLEFATVTAYNIEDSLLVNGTVTDEKGSYVMSLKPGNYFLEYSFVGLASYSLEVISKAPASPNMKLDPVLLKRSDKLLTNVEITATRNQVKFELDKKIFKPGEDALSSASNALDILDQVPSISVDPNGQIRIRGSQNITILIDGKPSILANSKQLQNLLPNKIYEVEVITNPSAKYDANGIAGIVNIVMSKEEEAPGLEGSINLRANYPHDYSVGLGLNQLFKKVNVFGNIGVRYWKRPKSTQRQSEFLLAEPIFSSEQSIEQIRRSASLDLNLGLDYSFNDYNTLTSSLVYEGSRQPHNAEVEYMNFNKWGQFDSRRLRLNDELENEFSLEYLLNFEKKYKDSDKKLTAYLEYTDGQERNRTNINEEYYDSTREQVSMLSKEQRSSVEELEQRVIAQVDYEHPYGDNGQFEIGYKSSYRRIKNDFDVEELSQSDWNSLDGLTNQFTYNEFISSIYLMNSKKIGKFGYQLGLRGEWTKIQTDLRENDQKTWHDPYLNIFPSAHFNYNMTDGDEFQLSYSKRINRPGFHHLNPFFSYTDDRFISIGNENLDPMFTDNFEFGYIKTWNNYSLNSSIYHRRTIGNIENVATIREDGITFLQPQNLGSEIVTGMELFIEGNPLRWLKIRGGLEGKTVRLNGLNTNSDYNNWRSNVSTRLRLPKKTSVQLRFFYVGSGRSIQGVVASRSRLDFSLSRQIMDGRGRFSFSIMDILQSFQFAYDQNSSGLISNVVERPWRRTFSTSFSYRWE